MKSKLNDNGVYINNTIVEIEKDASHKIIIRTANCDDGCRCSIGFRWNTYNKQSIVTINSKSYSSEREAITSEIKSEICAIIQRRGVKEHAELLYFMRQIAEEYNQLDLFEDEKY